MRSPFLVLCSVLSVAALAQPVFQASTCIPAIGAYPVEVRSFSSAPGLAQSGSDVIWDLSTLPFTLIGTTVDSVLAPQNTPYASDYPAANLSVRLNGSFGYYRLESDHVDDLGYRVSPGSPSFIYSDPARILVLPFSVGQSATDAAVANSTTTTLTVEVLASGEIRLADGVIPDAVLVRRTYVTSNSTAVSNTWFRESDALRPVGNLLSSGGVIIRKPQVDAPTGVSTTASAEVGFTLYPVPSSTTLHITVAGDTNGELRIYDPLGKQVGQLRIIAGTAEVDISALAPAIYVVELRTTHSSARQRFVKE